MYQTLFSRGARFVLTLIILVSIMSLFRTSSGQNTWDAQQSKLRLNYYREKPVFDTQGNLLFDTTSRAVPENALEALRNFNEGRKIPWSATWNATTGQIYRLTGGSSEGLEGDPDSIAEYILNEYRDLFWCIGEREGDIPVPEFRRARESSRSKPGRVGDHNKGREGRRLYNQYSQDLRAVGSSIEIRFNDNGLQRIVSTARVLPELSLPPRISEDDAIALATEWLGFEHGLLISKETPELVIYENPTPHLAYEFICIGPANNKTPYPVSVDAVSGAVRSRSKLSKFRHDLVDSLPFLRFGTEDLRSKDSANRDNRDESIIIKDSAGNLQYLLGRSALNYRGPVLNEEKLLDSLNQGKMKLDDGLQRDELENPNLDIHEEQPKDDDTSDFPNNKTDCVLGSESRGEFDQSAMHDKNPQTVYEIAAATMTNLTDEDGDIYFRSGTIIVFFEVNPPQTPPLAGYSRVFVRDEGATELGCFEFNVLIEDGEGTAHNVPVVWS